MDAFRNEGLGEADALEQSLANMSLHGNLREALEESFASSDETRMQQIGAVFEPDYLSAKVRHGSSRNFSRALSGSRNAGTSGRNRQEGREVVSTTPLVTFKPLSV